MADSVLLRPIGTSRTGDALFNEGRSKNKKARLGLLLGLVVLCIASLFFFGLPSFRVTRVFIDAPSTMDDNLILTTAGITGEEFIFSLDSGAMEVQLNQLISVRSAHVEKVFPNALRIRVIPRRPAVLTIFDGPEGLVFISVCEDGVVMPIGAVDQDWGLPILRGVRLENDGSSMRVFPAHKRLIDSVMALKDESHVILDLVSEFEIIPKGEHDFDLSIRFVHTPVRALTNPQIDAQFIRMILQTIDVLQSQSALVSEIDFRASEIVYRTRGR